MITTRTMTGRVRLSALVLAMATALGVLPAVPAVAAAPVGTISGRVSLGTTGHFAAAGEVVVTLERYEGGTPVPYPGVSATTDADGVYTFSGLGGDRFNVIFDYVGAGPYLAHATPYTSFFAPMVFDFTVPSAFVIAGRVSLETAGNYAGAGEVRVTATNSGRTVTTLTDATGRYDLGRLPVIDPGWQVQFDYLGDADYPVWYYTADQRGSASGPSRIGNSHDGYGYDTVLGAGVAFSGRLVMTDGAPFAGQTVTIVALTPGLLLHAVRDDDPRGRQLPPRGAAERTPVPGRVGTERGRRFRGGFRRRRQPLPGRHHLHAHPGPAHHGRRRRGGVHVHRQRGGELARLAG